MPTSSPKRCRVRAEPEINGFVEFLVGSRADEVPAQQYPQAQGMPSELAVSGPGYSP